MYMNNMQSMSCNCMHNHQMRPNMQMNQNENCNNDIIEDACPCIQNLANMDYNSCKCGFDEDNMFPTNVIFAQSYVPWQTINKTFVPCVGLKMGTIFSELVSPYKSGQSQEEIKYIKMKNEIGMGCNKC